MKDGLVAGGDGKRWEDTQGESLEIQLCNTIVLYTWHKELVT